MKQSYKNNIEVKKTDSGDWILREKGREEVILCSLLEKLKKQHHHHSDKGKEISVMQFTLI